MELLLKHRADPNTSDPKGKLLIVHALETNVCVDQVVAAGAAMNAREIRTLDVSPEGIQSSASTVPGPLHATCSTAEKKGRAGHVEF